MKKVRLTILILVIAVLGFTGYRYLYQDHRDISTETPVLNITPEQLLSKFKDNNTNELLNRTIAVSGLVTEIDGSTVSLDNKVSCSFLEPITIKLQEIVVIKGRCIGYDDLFELVKLDQCLVIK